MTNFLNERLRLLNSKDGILKKDEGKFSTDSKKEPQNAELKARLTKVITQRAAIKTAVNHTNKELLLLPYKDTASIVNYFSDYIHINKKDFLTKLHSDKWDAEPGYKEAVDVVMIDNNELLDVYPRTYKSKLNLVQHKRNLLMDFIGDYPSFGLWIVFTIGQMMLWFLLIPLLAGNMLNLKECLGQSYAISMKDRNLNVILPFVFVGVFCYFFYCKLADNYVIRDDYFFFSYNLRMKIYAIPGYAVSVFCFTSYLTMAKHFDKLNEEVKKGNSDPSSAEYAKKFLSLKKAFDNSFKSSALILSLFVFWAGLLIYALNTTETFKFYSKIAGHPLIPSDLVYLMGLLHTLMLLTFYIPIKLKFNTLEITQPTAMAESSVPDKTILQTLMENMGSVLVNVSPLLAAVVQQLFDVF